MQRYRPPGGQPWAGESLRYFYTPWYRFRVFWTLKKTTTTSLTMVLLISLPVREGFGNCGYKLRNICSVDALLASCLLRSLQSVCVCCACRCVCVVCKLCEVWSVCDCVACTPLLYRLVLKFDEVYVHYTCSDCRVAMIAFVIVFLL